MNFSANGPEARYTSWIQAKYTRNFFTICSYSHLCYTVLQTNFPVSYTGLNLSYHTLKSRDAEPLPLFGGFGSETFHLAVPAPALAPATATYRYYKTNLKSPPRLSLPLSAPYIRHYSLNSSSTDTFISISVLSPLFLFVSPFLPLSASPLVFNPCSLCSGSK